MYGCQEQLHTQALERDFLLPNCIQSSPYKRSAKFHNVPISRLFNSNWALISRSGESRVEFSIVPGMAAS